MQRDPPMPAATRAQIRWNAAYATELCRRACNRLFEERARAPRTTATG